MGTYTAYFDDFLIDDGTALDISELTASQENLISVYPNPSNEIFHLTNNLNDEFNSSVYTLSGELILTKNSANATDVIDLTDNPDGIYILRVMDKSHTYKQKLIKK